MDIPANAKYAIIREISQRTDNLLSVKQLCSLAGVSRSGYYHYLSTEEDRQRRERQDQEDFRRIVEAYQFRGYAKGARGIYMRLIHMDPPMVMNIKKIRRLMKKYGLKCPIRKVNPYRRMAKALKTSYVAPNLLNREFETRGPRAVLLTDITYSSNGKVPRCYLSAIIDASRKELLAWILMSRRANRWDNAPQESFFGHMKDEIDLSACTCFEQVHEAIRTWADYYNNERYQWVLPAWPRLNITGIS